MTESSMSMRLSTENSDTGGTATNLVAVPAVELTDIAKRFGSVVACDDVCLSVQRGEIHGLLGQNGAGKSTLMKILTGLVAPDSGRIAIDGEHVEISDPLVAAKLGISMVHQHFSLVGRMRVWENVTLGERGRVDRDGARRVVREVGDRYGLTVDPDAVVEDLTTGERQRVELVKCLRRDPDLLILDEPTSVLTLAESRELFSVLRHVTQDENKTVILISHKLDEILHATDRVTIMRSGAVVARKDTAHTDVRELAREMVGRELSKWTAATAVGTLDSLTTPTSDPTDQDLAAQDLAAQDAAAQDAAAQDLAAQDLAAQDLAAQDSAGQDSADQDLAEPDAKEPALTKTNTEEPAATEPDAEQQDAAEPDTADQNPAEPDPAEPAAEEPDTATPVTIENTTDQNPAEPEPAEPTTEEPDTEHQGTAEDSADPDPAEPEAAEPEAAEPEAAEPEAAEPEAAEPAAGEPDTATPVTAEREQPQEVRLSIKDAHATGRDGRPLLRGLSLEVRAGEILGLAGVEGNGQAALGDLLSSLIELDSGTVQVCGTTVKAGRPGAMHAAGVGVVPEDRHVSGCVLDMTVAENLVMADIGEVSRGSFVNPRRLRARAGTLIEEFDIAVPGPDTPMRLLSGGNQQKVVLARELAARPKVLVVAQPTRGLDVGAIEYMTERIYQAARSGIAILLISTELEEILTLSHRVAVIHRGAIVGEMARAEVDPERLGMMMGGQAA
ncbi:ATP-binding cassette domain-containing protein [Streptosporangium soli]